MGVSIAEILALLASPPSSIARDAYGTQYLLGRNGAYLAVLLGADGKALI